MTSVLAPPPAEVRPQKGVSSTHAFDGVAALIGVLGFFVSFAGSWQASYWGDEAASVMSAERSLSSLFRMLGHVDAVHGTYYVFLHFWIDAFGASELSTRLPSAIAIGVAAAGTVVLARALINSQVAVIAGIVFAVLPRVTFMGAEARSTAFATAIAVWLTVLLVHILRRRNTNAGVRFGMWAGYAGLFAAGIYLFLYVALLIPVHGLAVLILVRPRKRRLISLATWAVAAGVGLALATPVVIAGANQREQISFIGRRPPVEVLDAALHQWFSNVPLAILAWALIALSVVTVLVDRRARVTRVGITRHALAIMLAWMLIPSAILLIGTRLVTPMYSFHYLSISTPAVAIAIAVGIACFRARLVQAAALLLVVSLAVPTYLSQRGDFGKNGGIDWRQASAFVRENANPGDALVFDESVVPWRTPRLAIHLYPDSFQGLRDVTLARPFQETDGLWDETVPLLEATDRLMNIDTVWLLQYKGSSQSKSGTDILTLQRLGYKVAETTTVNRTIIIEMTR